MHGPYHNAIKKKKFEGLTIHIQPHGQDEEEMKKAAASGDAAPEVMDKGMEGSPLEEAGETPAQEAAEQAMGGYDADGSGHEHMPPPHTPPGHKKTSLREKAAFMMKKKGF